MPTDAEIVAAMQVTNEWSDMSRAERREFAIDVLAAAEEVRAKANECHALDRDYGLCQCPICRAYRAGRGDERFVAAHMPDQRMTQTHPPLGGHVQWSQPGDPASYPYNQLKEQVRDPKETLSAFTVLKEAMTEAELPHAPLSAHQLRPAPGQRQTFVAMNGARGTMTHDPLLGWVVDSDLTDLLGDP